MSDILGSQDHNEDIDNFDAINNEGVMTLN